MEDSRAGLSSVPECPAIIERVRSHQRKQRREQVEELEEKELPSIPSVTLPPTFQAISGASCLLPNLLTKVPFADDDWDRIEAAAEKEQEEEEEKEEAEAMVNIETNKHENTDRSNMKETAEEEMNMIQRAESKAKLQAFLDNPQVDVTKSRLAAELKVIIEEAQRRMNADKQKPTKKKKVTKKISWTENTAGSDCTSKTNIIASAIQKVEHEKGIGKTGSCTLTDDSQETDDILDGFMEGFNEELDDAIETNEANLASLWWEMTMVSTVLVAVVGIWAGYHWTQK